MREKFKYYINYIAIQIALPSIIIGLFCLLLFKNNSNYGFVGIGYFISIAIGATNSTLSLLLIGNALRRLKDVQEHSKALSLTLISLLVSASYLEII